MRINSINYSNILKLVPDKFVLNTLSGSIAGPSITPPVRLYFAPCFEQNKISDG